MSRIWKTIPVFISSTFRDMHAERDYLAKVVFPDLEERLKVLRCRIEPIDLRVGVDTNDAKTEKEREQQILKVCLREIDRSRPFFLVLLGDRYGWIPDENRILAAVMEERFETDTVGKSVTALEIEYAFLKKDPQQYRRSLIYLRNPLLYEKMPSDMATVYSDAYAADAMGKYKADCLTKLKKWILEDKDLKPHVQTYTLEWDQGIKPEGLELWGRQVTKDLFNAISEEVAISAPTAELTSEEVERFAIEEMVERLGRTFVGREELVEKAIALATSPVSKGVNWGLCLTGEHGAGKSSLFSHIHRQLEGRSDLLLLSHTAGVSGETESMLQRWISELCKFLQEPQRLPENYTPEDLERSFSSLLHRAAKQTRVVLLIDALNEFLRFQRSEFPIWLPKLWPTNARFLSTSVDGQGIRSLSRKPGIQTIQIPPLEVNEVELIAAKVYGRHHRKPNRLVLGELRKKRHPDGTPCVANPLWLCLALDLLNLLDADDFSRAETETSGVPEDRLYRMVLSFARDLPETLIGIYSELMRRVEKLTGSGYLRAFCSLTALSRSGLQLEDYQHLIPIAANVLCPEEPNKRWDPLRFAILRRAFRYHLVFRGYIEQYDFAHQQLRIAVYAQLQKNWRVEPTIDIVPIIHGLIADYLETLKPGEPARTGEIMWQLLGTRDGPRVATYLASHHMGVIALPRFLVEDWETPYRSLLRFVLSLLDLRELDGGIIFNVAKEMLDLLPEGISRNQGQINLTEQILIGVKNYLEYCYKKSQENKEISLLLAMCLHEMGILYNTMGQFNKSLRSYEKAIAISMVPYERDPDNSSFANALASCHNNMGSLYKDMGQHQQSLRAYEKGITIAMKLNEQDPDNALFAYNLINFYINIGSLCNTMGQYQQSLNSLEKALTMAMTLYERDSVNSLAAITLTGCHINMGNLFREMGQHQHALKAYEKALTVVEAWYEKDPYNFRIINSLADCYNNIGSLYRTMGQYKQSLSFNKKALAIYDELQMQDPGKIQLIDRLAHCHYTMGSIYRATAQHQQSLISFKKALDIYNKLHEQDPENAQFTYHLANCHHSIGLVNNVQGQYQQSLNALKEAIVIYEALCEQDSSKTKLTLIDLANCYEIMGYLYRAQGKHQQLLSTFKKALGIYEALHQQDPSNNKFANDLVGSHLSTARLYNDMGLKQLSLNSEEKAELVIRNAMKHGCFVPASTEINELSKRMSQKADLVLNYDLKLGKFVPTTTEMDEMSKRLSQEGKNAPTRIDIPPPHPNANSEREAKRNIEYQRKLTEWRELPWWKRIYVEKPEK